MSEEDNVDKEWLHAERDLQPSKDKLVRYKTQCIALQTQATFKNSTVKRAAFEELQRKPTMALPKKKNEFIEDKNYANILDEWQI